MLLDRTNTLGAGMGHLSKLEEPPEEPDYGLEPVEPPPPPTPSEEPAPPTAPARYGHSQCAEEAPVDTAHLPSAGMASAQLVKIKVWASMARDSDVTIPMVFAWTTYLLSFTSFSFLSPLLWVGVWAIFGFSARSAFGTPTTKRSPFTEHDVESFVPQMVRAINLALEAYQDVIEAHDPKKALAVAVSFAVTSQLLAYISAPLLLFAAVNVACGYHLLCQNETAYFALSEGALAARDAALQLSTVQTMRSHASKLWELWTQGLEQIQKFGPALLAGLGGIGGAFWLSQNSIYKVDAGCRAIKFNRFYGILDRTYDEGMHFVIPWLERPIIYDVRARPRTIASLTGSRDLQMVNISLRTLCRPDAKKLSEILRQLGVEYDEKVLPSIVNEVVKSVVAKFNAAQLLTQRELVSRKIREELVIRAKQYNIVLDDVSITHLNFSAEYEKAVEQKQVAQQQAERARYTVQKAHETKKNTILRAQGDMEAAKKVGDAVKKNPGFIELKRIEVAREIAKNLAKGNNRVMLNSDSLLLNLFKREEAEGALGAVS